MAYWLIKSEPAKYSFADLRRDGKTMWDGVRNNQAALYLKAMKIGDEALYYHSVEELAVVGIAKVCKEAFIDPRRGSWPWSSSRSSRCPSRCRWPT